VKAEWQIHLVAELDLVHCLLSAIEQQTVYNETDFDVPTLLNVKLALPRFQCVGLEKRHSTHIAGSRCRM